MKFEGDKVENYHENPPIGTDFTFWYCNVSELITSITGTATVFSSFCMASTNGSSQCGPHSQ